MFSKVKKHMLILVKMMEYFIRERGNAKKKQKQIKNQPNKKYHIEITEIKK